MGFFDDLKEKIETMPKIKRRFWFGLFIPGLVAVLVGAIVVAICCTSLARTYGDEALQTCIPVIIWGVFAAAYCVAIIIGSRRVRKEFGEETQAEIAMHAIRYMPEYQRRFTIGVLISCAVYIIVAIVFACVCGSIARKTGNNAFATYIPLAGCIGGGVVLLAVIVPLGIWMRVRKRRDLLCDLTLALEEKYTLMPIEEAEQQLIEQGVIRDGGLVVVVRDMDDEYSFDEDTFAEDVGTEKYHTEVIPFEKCKAVLLVNCDGHSVVVDMLLTDEEGIAGESESLSRELYTYIIEKQIPVINAELWELFLHDKEQLVKNALKRHNVFLDVDLRWLTEK